VGAGHEVSTVAEEGLKGFPDEKVVEACKMEGKVILTGDRGFGHILEHPPGRHAGLIVLRHPKPSVDAYRLLVEQVIRALRTESPGGALWIVEPNRIRVHDTQEPMR
jgi:predicted nuclease of predicted toxin-antitoxin system